eukprot:scaffold18184_cov96-Isochrysis_galbana.AAC.2
MACELRCEPVLAAGAVPGCSARPPRSATPSLRALPFALPAGPPPWRCDACRAPSRPARVANSLTVSAR